MAESRQPSTGSNSTGSSSQNPLAPLVSSSANQIRNEPPGADREGVQRLLALATEIPTRPSYLADRAASMRAVIDDGEAEVKWCLEEDVPVDEEDTRLKQLSTLTAPALSTPVDGTYSSPFTALFTGDTARIHRVQRAEIIDQRVHEFFSGLASRLPLDLIEKAEKQLEWTLEKLSEHPGFEAGAGDLGVALKSPGAVTSFPPCIMSHHSRAKDGRKVPHLVSLLAFIAMGPGPLGPAIARRVNISFQELIGIDKGDSPIRAEDVPHPGVYLVSPAGGQRLGIIGMSYALGLASRTSYYHRTTWGPLGKMGRVQGASEYGTLSTLMVTTAHRPESFDEGILRKYALFWIDPDEKVFHDLPVPSGAVYAVESIAILITKSWESSTSSIVQEALHPSSTPAAGAPQTLIGLNSNSWDIDGAFVHQSPLSIQNARRLIRMLMDFEQVRYVLPLWNMAFVEDGECLCLFRDDNSSTEQNKEAARLYQEKFRTIFPPGTPISTIYRNIRMRTAIMRRALEAVDPDAKFRGYCLPRGNPVKWRSRREQNLVVWSPVDD
ncbi:hypothetical protein DB88DRAFT_475545 [Papiliotrema laurentii]|uniref:Uncharacterized protein n=1 Tax=Papiliotrema laurentii TaxID=5418 RepID=A0AAD9CT39_PAPLA|nr:hypothetical protein DB88DRAFT_475545 [Papiliotrema laurentii]